MPSAANPRPRLFAAALAGALVAAAPALAQDAGDAARGAELWAKCKACHTLEKNGRHIVGPRLAGLFGRRAGTQPGYGYSPAMRAAGIVWSEATLDEYLAKTVDYIPGSKMYGGLAIRQDRLDLIAWLKRATAE
jgi:cytochrome c